MQQPSVNESNAQSSQNLEREGGGKSAVVFKAMVAPPKHSMPDHLKMRLWSYKQKRSTPSSIALQEKIKAATKRRQNCLERRAQNAREAEARCQRLADAFAKLQEQREALKRFRAGEQVQAPYHNLEMQEALDSIQEDLTLVFTRLGRDVSRTESALFEKPLVMTSIMVPTTTQRLRTLSIQEEEDKTTEENNMSQETEAGETTSSTPRCQTPVNTIQTNRQPMMDSATQTMSAACPHCCARFEENME